MSEIIRLNFNKVSYLTILLYHKSLLLYVHCSIDVLKGKLSYMILSFALTIGSSQTKRTTHDRDEEADDGERKG
jgi:hypothetical protein